MFCSNCGKDISNNAKFCDGCGSPVVTSGGANQSMNNAASAENDFQQNKVIYILSYLLFFLPLVSCPNSKMGRYHANQGLLLLITAVAGQIVISIFSSILWHSTFSLALWRIFALITWGWVIVITALVIIGMINASKGLMKPLPVIGKFRLIK